jgi:tetrahydromethanopterin S-methyltransferase subunit D
MDKVNDGGPAFPIPLAPGELYTETGSGCGMTLRDWFAGHALTGLMSNTTMPCAPLAETAYRVADAMLAERAKEKS